MEETGYSKLVAWGGSLLLLPTSWRGAGGCEIGIMDPNAARQGRGRALIARTAAMRMRSDCVSVSMRGTGKGEKPSESRGMRQIGFVSVRRK